MKQGWATLHSNGIPNYNLEWKPGSKQEIACTCSYHQWRSQDYSMGGQSKGEKWLRGEGVGGGCPPSQGRENFEKFVYQNGNISHIKYYYKG